MEKEVFHLVVTPAPENVIMVVFGTVAEASEVGKILRSSENESDFAQDFDDDQDSKSFDEHPKSSVSKNFMKDDQESKSIKEHPNSPVPENLMDSDDQDSKSFNEPPNYLIVENYTDSSITSPPLTLYVNSSNGYLEGYELPENQNLKSVKTNVFASPAPKKVPLSTAKTSVTSSPQSSSNKEESTIAAYFDINAENKMVHFKAEMIMHKGHKYECNVSELNGKFYGFLPAYVPSGKHICECSPPGDVQWTYMILSRRTCGLQVDVVPVYCAPAGIYKGQEFEMCPGQLNSPLMLVKNDIATEKVSKGLPSGKFHSCLYCQAMFAHISRHLINRHSDEADVQDLLALPANSKERNDLLKQLRLLGDATYNKSVPKDQRLTVRKPMVSKTSECLSCPKCHALLAPRNYSRHERNCLDRPPNRKRVAQQALMLERLGDEEDNENLKIKLMKVLLDPLKGDPCSHEINSDFCLVQLAERYAFMHSNNPASLRNDRQHLRRLARLLTEIREIDSTIIDFEDCVHNVCYDSVIEAVYRLCDFDKTSGMFGKPSLAKALGSALSMLVRTLENYHLNKGLFKDSVECRSIERFSSIHDQSYTTCIGRHRLHPKTSQQIPLPEPKDIKLFSEYMAKEARACYDNLKNNGFSYGIWQRLGEAELGKIILFNRRRVSEVSLMYVNLFQKRTPLDDSTKASLTVLERALADKYQMMALLRKQAHMFHVLLDQEQCTHLELFLTFRREAGVEDSNEYLFGVPNRSIYMDGASVIRKFSVECNAGKPHLLRAAYLRKQVATMSQLFTLNDNEIGQVARFMGHSKAEHNNFYRQDEKFIRVTSWAKFLSLAGDANINKFRGKTLDQIVNEVESLDDFEEEARNSDQLKDAMEGLADISNEEVLTIIEETENFDQIIDDANMEELPAGPEPEPLETESKPSFNI